MVGQAKLSAVLIEFAHTLVTDLTVQDILDRLVVAMVDILDVTAAGVTLLSCGAEPHCIAASSGARELEQLQTQLGQSPCLTAHDTGEPVAIPDLSMDDAFSEFGPATLAAGMAAVFTFPLRHNEVRIGALDLYRDTPGPLSARDLAAAQTLADVAAAYLVDAQSRQDTLDGAQEGIGAGDLDGPVRAPIATAVAVSADG